MKEAEIQKLQANLTVSKVVQHLSDDQEKENGRLHGLETEPVKLTGNRSGEQAETVYFKSIKFLLTYAHLSVSTESAIIFLWALTSC